MPFKTVPIMWRRPFRQLFVVLLLAMNTEAARANAQQVNPHGKKAWEWTVDERIAARCDRSLAKARVERARAEGLAPNVRKNGRVAPLAVTDVIIGRHTPHLFLPTEVFETVVHHGFLIDGWRDVYAEEIASSGLPDTFWEQLSGVSALYIEDLRERDRIARDPDVDARFGLYQALQGRLCANRAAALAQARLLFGPNFDVFMYRHIAPTKKLDTDQVQDPKELKSRERGCR